jgi:hypothetical protein
MVLPNLFYASVPGPMVRQAAITLSGGGVNSGAHRALAVWPVLDAWHLFILVAAVGLVYALSRREWDALLWALGSVTLGFLAYLRFGEIHYYTAAIAAAVPLVLRALRAVPVARTVVAAVVVAAVLWQPYRDQVEAARARGDEATRTDQVNDWVAPRLQANDVALTFLEADDARFFHLVRFYTPWAPARDYRFLPPDTEAAQWIRGHAKHVAYVVAASETDVDALLSGLGLDGRGRRVEGAPGFVYAVT